jgi:hypothetical protein
MKITFFSPLLLGLAVSNPYHLPSVIFQLQIRLARIVYNAANYENVTVAIRQAIDSPDPSVTKSFCEPVSSCFDDSCCKSVLLSLLEQEAGDDKDFSVIESLFLFAICNQNKEVLKKILEKSCESFDLPMLIEKFNLVEFTRSMEPLNDRDPSTKESIIRLLQQEEMQREGRRFLFASFPF